MNDDELSRALRSLPSAQARPGFTERVLGRVRTGGGVPGSSDREVAEPGSELGRPAGRSGLRVACAGALGIALATGLAWLLRSPSESPEPALRRPGASETATLLMELRAEQRNLAAELRSLARSAERSRPVLLLGADGDTEVILDLEELLRRRAVAVGSEAPDAAHR